MASGQLIFQPPMFGWPSDDQQTMFKEWQGHITLTLEASNIPPERWYASIIGFLGTEGFKWWQHLNISKKDEEKKHPENMFKAFAHFRSLNIPLESHWWDVQWHQTGQTRNHQSARPVYQDFSWEVWLHNREWEAMPIRATLPCHETLWSQEVGQITDSTEWNSHLWQATTTCQTAWGNH